MNVNYSNNCNRTSFGAFNQAQKNVVDHFSDVIREISPEHRKKFVQEVAEIIEGAKGCPIAVEHEMVQATTPYYAPVVEGKRVTTTNKHNNKANYIVDVMRRASEYAKNIADANANIEEIKHVLNFPA
ncbi:MAG: hypothetical protein K6E29_08680 [Cyanobacteria bacterium RUI128]|nr:hypothetical protein [Cyanobacteria bacterium RUI128]